MMNNQSVVLNKQNSINELKLRLIRDTVDQLYEQKCFVVKNIDKAKENLRRESSVVEQRMMKENDDDEYLISVKKAVKISQAMLEMGMSAIT